MSSPLVSIKVFFLLIAQSYLLVIPAYSTETKPDNLCPNAIHFGLVEGSRQKDGRSLDVDVVNALSNLTGCRFVIEELPYRRIEAQLKTGGIDMSSRWFETAERQSYGWFAHYQNTKNLAIFDQRILNAADLINIENNQKISIGTVKGFKYGTSIDYLISEVKKKQPDRLTEFRDRETQFNGLILGRAQIIFLPLDIFHELRQKNPGNSGGLQSLDIFPSDKAEPGGLIMSKKTFSKELAIEWQAKLNVLCESGTILTIMQSYFPATTADVACIPN